MRVRSWLARKDDIDHSAAAAKRKNETAAPPQNKNATRKSHHHHVNINGIPRHSRSTDRLPSLHLQLTRPFLEPETSVQVRRVERLAEDVKEDEVISERDGHVDYGVTLLPMTQFVTQYGD